MCSEEETTSCLLLSCDGKMHVVRNGGGVDALGNLEPGREGGEGFRRVGHLGDRGGGGGEEGVVGRGFVK